MTRRTVVRSRGFALALALFAPSTAAVLSGDLVAQVPHVIVETDMGGDSDDAAMVAFANRLADQGQIVLLAVMHNGNNEWGGSAISAVNTYYNRPDVPIGTYRTAAEANRPHYHPLSDPNNPNSPRTPLSYTGPTIQGDWVQILAENYPCDYRPRLRFPDAVDVYRDVLARAPDHSVVIVNGGYLGNLSNLISQFDVEPNLRSLFQRKVLRKTGAVGGHNTCNNGVFPAGLAEHVLNHPLYHTATMSWLSAPAVDPVATRTGPEMANLPDSNPVREAYRFKMEVESARRGTAIAWDWHIIDVLTSYSLIGWDQARHQGGLPFFDRDPPAWMNVANNCAGSIVGGAPPVPHWEFQGLSPSLTGQSIVQVSQQMRQRFFDDGIYAAPVSPWAPQREHLNITATFLDETTGGLSVASGHQNAAAAAGRFSAPLSTTASNSGAWLITEGRRYHDVSVVGSVTGVPRMTQFAPANSSPAILDVDLRVETRLQIGQQNGPKVRIVAWPGRGWIDPNQPHLPASAGQPVLRVEFWDQTSTGYRVVTSKDLRNTRPGDPFQFHISILGDRVSCKVNEEPAFASPVRVAGSHAADGEHVALGLRGTAPGGAWQLDYVLVRPTAGNRVMPDVYIDKAGTAWFSYVTDGDLESDFLRDILDGVTGAQSHFVEFDLVARPGWGSGFLLHLAWDDPNPNVLDWIALLGAARPEGIGSGHWVYAIEGFPWEARDRIRMEYRERVEVDRSPASY